jgi:hypothetical protein
MVSVSFELKTGESGPKRIGSDKPHGVWPAIFMICEYELSWVLLWVLSFVSHGIFLTGLLSNLFPFVWM